MKRSILSFFVLSLFIMFSSCQKGDDIKDDKLKETKDWEVKKDEGDKEVCEWDGSKVSDPEVWEEYIVEPLIANEECGCIVEGVVKYAKIDSDFAYVIYYGKGECDNWAHLVTYYEGEDKKTKKCKFELECEGGDGE